jgi:hypothetical protein
VARALPVAAQSRRFGSSPDVGVAVQVTDLRAAEGAGGLAALVRASRDSWPVNDHPWGFFVKRRSQAIGSAETPARRALR